MKIFIIVFGVIAVAVYLLNMFVERQLEKRAHEGAYNDCNKIWSARGLYNHRTEENTLESFQRAFDAGAVGAEVDFFYDPGTDQFIVSHDAMPRNPDGSLQNPDALTLEQLFNTFGEKYYWWLDFKNLDRITKQETQAAIERLKTIMAPHQGLIDKAYVEGSNPLMVSRYTRAGIKTIMAWDLLPAKNPLSEYLINLYKIAYYFCDITVVATRATHRVNPDNPKYSPKIQKQLSNIPIFLFHTPDDPEYLQSLLDDPLVRVILVGAGESVDRFDRTSCKAESETH
ncbi:hypothetical protein L4C34_13065 [Vibrio profundum]|uniref:hypothetical protein n=1 Tax=Vibrio profundum TaxID=2910247 RepID=UPI003D0F31CC